MWQNGEANNILSYDIVFGKIFLAPMAINYSCFQNKLVADGILKRYKAVAMLTKQYYIGSKISIYVAKWYQGMIFDKILGWNSANR